jgi:WD40 repeat protein
LTRGATKATLVSAGFDGAVRVWDVLLGGAGPASLKERRALGPPRTPLWSVALSPDGHRAAAGGTGHAVRLWDLASGEESLRPGGHAAGAVCVALGPDGRQLASGGDDFSVRVWDAATGRPGRRFEGHKDQVVGVAFSPGGRGVYAAARDGKVLFWDLASGAEAASREARAAVTGFAVAGDGSRLALGCRDGGVEVWDAGRRRRALAFDGSGVPVNGLAFSPDGRWLAGVSGDSVKQARPGVIRIWDLARRREAVLTPGGKGVLSAAAFSPDGRLLATTGYYPAAAVKLWDLEGNPLRTLGSHENAGRSLAFLPDGRLACSGADGTVRVWPVAGGEPQTIRLGPSSGQIFQVVASPDGRHLVTANGNGTLSVLRISAR